MVALQMYSKALVILPYISVVAEKTEHLTSILKEMKCKVKGYTGGDESGTPLAPRFVPSHALLSMVTIQLCAAMFSCRWWYAMFSCHV